MFTRAHLPVYASKPAERAILQFSISSLSSNTNAVGFRLFSKWLMYHLQTNTWTYHQGEAMNCMCKDSRRWQFFPVAHGENIVLQFVGTVRTSRKKYGISIHTHSIGSHIKLMHRRSITKKTSSQQNRRQIKAQTYKCTLLACQQHVKNKDDGWKIKQIWQEWLQQYFFGHLMTTQIKFAHEGVMNLELICVNCLAVEVCI